MDFDNQDIKNFKKVIEDIVDAKLKNEGITKYISAIVTTVNNDNTVDVVIPPDTSKVVRNLYNKTRGDLSVGDSVELCTKNGKLSNAWVSVKHGAQDTSGGGTGQGLPIDSIIAYEGDDTPDGYEEVDDLFVLGDIAVDSIRSKNLLDINTKKIGSYDTSGNWSDAADCLTLEFIPVKENKNYILSSLNFDVSKYTTLRIIYWSNTKVFAGCSQDISGFSNYFTIPHNIFYISLCFFTSQTADINDLTQGQLEEGTTSTPYRPYQNLNVNIVRSYSTNVDSTYNCGYINNIVDNDYSADEKWTGKYWVDGKKIYCKTNVILNNTLYNTQFFVTHNIANVDTVIDFRMLGLRNDGAFFVAPCLYPNYQFYMFDVSKTQVRIRIDNGLQGGYLIPTIYYTLYYTKTTDLATRNIESISFNKSGTIISKEKDQGGGK